MTVHHDKMAYGRFLSSSEDLKENDIEKMLAELAQDYEEYVGLEQDVQCKRDENDKKTPNNGSGK